MNGTTRRSSHRSVRPYSCKVLAVRVSAIRWCLHFFPYRKMYPAPLKHCDLFVLDKS